MKEIRPIYVDRQNKYHLYTSTIASEKPRRYECCCRDAGVQHSSPREVVCTCRNTAILRRPQEVRYYSNPPLGTFYGSRSFTDIGVGSVKPLQRKKVIRIYLPETDDRGVGSSDLSSFIIRKAKPYRTSHHYDQKNTSTRGVRGIDDTVIVINEKLSPITNTKSEGTSPEQSIRNHLKNVDFGSNTQEKTLASISTQIGEETNNDNIKIEVRTVEVSFEHVKEPVKQNKKSYPKMVPRVEEREKRISKRAQEAERVYSSDSLVQHVHNLENPSEDKHSHADVMENKLEREYRRMFCTKSKESKDQRVDVERTSATLKSTSLLRRRFEALRRGLAKKEDSKRNDAIPDKESSNVSATSKRDVSIASDPPSLESRSYSDLKLNNHPNAIQNIASNPKVNYVTPFETNKSNRLDEDSSYQGAEGMFKLWGKKFNLEDEELPQTSKFQNQNESVNKKNGKKFFFFKKKNSKEPKELFKKGVTTGRCEVGDGLMIKIGAANTKPRSTKKKEPKVVDRIPPTDPMCDQYDEIFRKAWLQKFLAQTIESRNSVKIRWNNNAYATSSSTIFEIMENVYKDTGIVFRSKSEITAAEPSYYKSAAKQRVNFVQDIQAWMIPKLIPDKITQVNFTNTTDEEPDKNKIQVRISDQKWVIDKSKAFAQKIEVVLHSQNIVKACENPSSEYLTINIPKGFFSDSGTDSGGQNLTSNEEVYKIVEYESPENKPNFEIGDHLNDIKLTVSLKDSRNFESNIVETVIKRPSIQRDVVIQGSKVSIPTRCNVIGVGIITQPDMNRVRKPILKIQDEYSDESDHSIQTRVKSKFAETYLQEYYRQWSPLGIDCFSWCFSDTQLQCCSDESQDSINNQGDCTKSCPNIYDSYMTSTVMSSCGTSCCTPCGPMPLCDPWYSDKPNLITKMKNKIKQLQPEPCSEEKRVLPKDSLEVFRRRKLYAMSDKSKWSPNNDQPCLIPSSESKCAEDTSPTCPPKAKKSCWKPTPQGTKTKICKKHVYIPDCEALNDSLCKQWESIRHSGILTFKGAAKCEMCEKKGTQCAKHAGVNPTPTCEIPPPNRPCMDEPPVLVQCKANDSRSSSLVSLKMVARSPKGCSPRKSPCASPPEPCPPRPKPPRSPSPKPCLPKPCPPPPDPCPPPNACPPSPCAHKPPPLCPVAPKDPVCYPRECHPFPPPCPPPACPASPKPKPYLKPPPSCPVSPKPCPDPPPCPVPGHKCPFYTPPPCPEPPKPCPGPPPACPTPGRSCPFHPQPCPVPTKPCPEPPPACPPPPRSCPVHSPACPVPPPPCPATPPSCPAHPPPSCPAHPPPSCPAHPPRPAPPQHCPNHAPPACPAHPPPPPCPVPRPPCPDPPPTCPAPPGTCPVHPPPPPCPIPSPPCPVPPQMCPGHSPPPPCPIPPPPCPGPPPNCPGPPAPCPKPPPPCPKPSPPCPDPPPDTPCSCTPRKVKSKKPKRDKCVVPGKPPCGSPVVSGIRLHKGRTYGSSPSNSSSSRSSSKKKKTKSPKLRKSPRSPRSPRTPRSPTSPRSPCSPSPCSPKPPCSERPSPCPPKPPRSPCSDKPSPCPPKPPKTCSDKPSPCPPKPPKTCSERPQARKRLEVPIPAVRAPPSPSSYEKRPCTLHPKCKQKSSCKGCKKTGSSQFPWPTRNQNSNQCSVKSFNMSSGGTSMNYDMEDNTSNDECQQCPSKTSCRTPPKVSGIFLKMRPGRSGPNESPQQDVVAKHCTAVNKFDDDIVINIKKTTDSTEEIREGFNIKVQDFDGNTLYERRDYTTDSDNVKCIQQKRHSVLNEMYKNSNVHVVSTSRQVQKVECDEERNYVGDAKSEASIANLIEINFKLKVTQGEKTTEYNVGTDDASDRTKFSAKSQIGQQPQEVFILKDAAEQCTDENNDKNDINIKIVIKNYKQKNKNQPTTAPFSESTVIRKFQTVSTGYNTADGDERNIYSDHRTVDLDTTNETSTTKVEICDTNASEECVDVTSMNAMPVCNRIPTEGKVDTRRIENTNDIQNYICTQNSTYSKKNASLSSSLVTQDIAKGSDKDDMTSHSLVVPTTVLTREEKKSILKKVLEKVNRTNTKDKMNQFKDVLNMILTDSDHEQKNKGFNDKVKKMAYSSLKPNVRKSTGSMNNYYKTESSLSSPEASAVNPNVMYPTEIVSGSSVRDSDESYEDDKPATCLCSTFAARLNVGSISGGGCCCRTPAKTDEETFCDLRTEEDFLLLNYKTIEYIDVETQNSRYFCNSNKISVHSRAVSSTFRANGFKGEVSEVVKAESIEKDTRDFAVSVHHQVPCRYNKINRSTTLGISDEDQVYIMNTKPTNVAVAADLSKEQNNDDDEKRRKKIYSKYQRVTDIWQSYETKKAVLEIYAEKTMSDEGGNLVAKLPKFVHDKESDIEINYGKYVQSLYQGIKNSRVF